MAEQTEVAVNEDEQECGQCDSCRQLDWIEEMREEGGPLDGGADTVVITTSQGNTVYTFHWSRTDSLFEVIGLAKAGIKQLEGFVDYIVN